MPTIRRQVLATTLLAPDRSWYLSELANQLGLTTSSAQRELDNLVQAGIVLRFKDGNRVRFQADRTSPLFPELQGLMRKSSGGVDVIRGALDPLRDHIQLAFIYGSFATQESLRNSSDIDVIVVGRLRTRQVVDALQNAQRALGREINPTVYTPEEFSAKLSGGNHFLTTVANSDTLPVIGDTHVLGTFIE